MFKTRTKNKALALLLVLTMVIAFVPVAAHANYTPTTINTVQTGFGDPNKPATAPECFISLTYNSETSKYDASYSDNIAASYFPGEVALYTAPGSGFSGTLTLVASNSSIWFETYDQYGVATTHSSINYATNSNWNRDNNQYELSYLFATKMTAAGDVYVKDGSGNDATTLVTIHFPGPLPYTMPGATTTPTGFEGYLPVGQFATGTGWGSPYSSGTTPKIVGAYSSTGLSLGAPGGYAEYDMAINNYETVNGVSTKIQRPYGVDFVVYGNAFVGNPEAGSVKVYGVEKGKTASKWYELAGSLYYSDITLRDVTVTYKKVTSTDTTFTTKGIWYRIDDASNNEVTGWTKFNQTVKNGVQQDTTVAWWPEEAEGYLGTNGVYGNVDDVIVDTTANTITYKHVTIVRDTDTTADYAFGYFDITPNGSSYGTAVNPYVYGTTGGNGYDLDWAVDSDGTPVELSTISKIRVYSSAGMKTDGTNLFTIPAVFGETSAELCGIYACTATGGGTATAPQLWTATNSEIAISNMGSRSLTAGYYYLTSSSSAVFVNGSTPTLVSSGRYFVTIQSGKTYQIITQNGTEAPFVTVITGV